MNIKYTQRMQRREMTADDQETLVVHIGKANTKYNVQITKYKTICKDGSTQGMQMTEKPWLCTLGRPCKANTWFDLALL